MARVRVPVAVRYSDLDTNGHVNNSAILTLLEDVRYRLFNPYSRNRAVVARHEIEYLAQLPWSPEPIAAEVWISQVGRSSVHVAQVLRHSEDDAVVYARVASVIVYLRRDTDDPRPLTDEERDRFSAMMDAPLAFR
jgi:acyl-CoA thioester hydrolase